MPIYHEISVDLKVLANRQLQKALSISFAPTATLKLLKEVLQKGKLAR